MLVNISKMLKDAKAGRYAVPAFDVSNYEMMKAVLDACEEERSPALLMSLEVDLGGKGMSLMSSMIKSASEFYSIPVCLQLDHATTVDSIKRAIDSGYSSVMFDGSALPFEENAEISAKVVEMAHKYNVTVEAELGHVGNAMVGNLSDKKENEDPEMTLTVPSEVVEFIKRTNVDALAIAIGTAHGVYKKTPTLRIDRLDEITSVCDIPLVLHGGSGTPNDQMQNAISHGITKINIYSDVVGAMNSGLKNSLNNMTNPSTWPAYIFEDARAKMKEVVKNKLITFGSNDKIK